MAGGWALDLFLGRETRPHGDVEVAVLRADQEALRTHLASWDLHYAESHQLHAWPEGTRLELPVHELWARHPDDTVWRLEVLLNESRDGRWLYRRDPRISRALDELGISTPNGLPALSPEVVLLYKARHVAAKDEADFENALPVLGDSRRSWLAHALDISDPGHPWLRRLRA